MFAIVFSAALFYFVLVFGAVLGYEAVRFVWIGPHLGDRVGELALAPTLLASAVVAARWVLDSDGLVLSRWCALGMGLIAAAMALAVEFALVAPLLDLSTREYLEMRDPVLSLAYYSALALFALLPAAFGGAKRG